jgi:hypothetical protein
VCGPSCSVPAFFISPAPMFFKDVRMTTNFSIVCSYTTHYQIQTQPLCLQIVQIKGPETTPESDRVRHQSGPSRLYHRLVRQRQRHWLQLQSSPEGGAVCPTHHRGYTACPPGHLQHPMSQEGQQDYHGPEPRHVHPASRRRQYRCIKSGAERMKNFSYLPTIRLLNSHH